MREAIEQLIADNAKTINTICGASKKTMELHILEQSALIGQNMRLQAILDAHK